MHLHFELGITSNLKLSIGSMIPKSDLTRVPLLVLSELVLWFYPSDLFLNNRFPSRNTWVVEVGWHSTQAEAKTQIPLGYIAE